MRRLLLFHLPILLLIGLAIILPGHRPFVGGWSLPGLSALAAFGWSLFASISEAVAWLVQRRRDRAAPARGFEVVTRDDAGR